MHIKTTPSSSTPFMLLVCQVALCALHIHKHSFIVRFFGHLNSMHQCYSSKIYYIKSSSLYLFVQWFILLYLSIFVFTREPYICICFCVSIILSFQLEGLITFWISCIASKPGGEEQPSLLFIRKNLNFSFILRGQFFQI